MIRFMLLMILAVPLCILPLGAAADETPAMPQPPGTWVLLELLPSGAALPAMMTIHQDGTFVVSGIHMFGGLPGSTQRLTPLQGVWERTGPRAFRATGLHLVFDAFTSLLIGFSRVRAAIEFPAGSTNELQGIAFQDFLACPTPVTCPDPQDPSAQWMPDPLASSAPVSAKRLRMVETGPLP